ncbi:hypothetical protein [Streptomyces salinarius]|uniref:hypothetical protein n=1 Tax=Streptomyces salinarius TaxID=2762598 RepID=UPI003F48C6E0
MSEQIPAAALRAAAQAIRLAQSSSNPYVMVRHGRREDRAAVYDRFVLACARCARAGDGSGVEEVWAAWQAINLRARLPVREAASKVAGYALLISEPDGAGILTGLRISNDDHVQFRRQLAGDDEWISWELGDFVAIARDDLNRRWWTAPIRALRGLVSSRHRTARRQEIQAVDASLASMTRRNHDQSATVPSRQPEA